VAFKAAGKILEVESHPHTVYPVIFYSSIKIRKKRWKDPALF